ncbi:MAG TPA: DUF177 domain-containing protein [Candidatus Nanoarchaeia archaeon]|nr:DUF177 domain-containing protein [Candidatus Nanoarchaeia archaeon]
MYLNAHDILGHDQGTTASFEIADERPELADISLASSLSGNVKLLRTSFGLLVSGAVKGSIKLDCHRCLKKFDQPLSVKFAGEFADKPEVEQWPIEPDGQIDLAPLVGQELILAIPIKTLCRLDCPGLCAVCGKPMEPKHEHADQPRPSNIRIVKGKK